MSLALAIDESIEDKDMENSLMAMCSVSSGTISSSAVALTTTAAAEATTTTTATTAAEETTTASATTSADESIEDMENSLMAMCSDVDELTDIFKPMMKLFATSATTVEDDSKDLLDEIDALLSDTSTAEATALDSASTTTNLSDTATASSAAAVTEIIRGGDATLTTTNATTAAPLLPNSSPLQPLLGRPSVESTPLLAAAVGTAAAAGTSSPAVASAIPPTFFDLSNVEKLFSPNSSWRTKTNFARGEKLDKSEQKKLFSGFDSKYGDLLADDAAILDSDGSQSEFSDYDDDDGQLDDTLLDSDDESPLKPSKPYFPFFRRRHRTPIDPVLLKRYETEFGLKKCSVPVERLPRYMVLSKRVNVQDISRYLDRCRLLSGKSFGRVNIGSLKSSSQSANSRKVWDLSVNELVSALVKNSVPATKSDKSKSDEAEGGSESIVDSTSGEQPKTTQRGWYASVPGVKKEKTDDLELDSHATELLSKLSSENDEIARRLGDVVKRFKCGVAAGTPLTALTSTLKRDVASVEAASSTLKREATSTTLKREVRIDEAPATAAPKVGDGDSSDSKQTVDDDETEEESEMRRAAALQNMFDSMTKMAGEVLQETKTAKGDDSSGRVAESEDNVKSVAVKTTGDVKEKTPDSLEVIDVSDEEPEIEDNDDILEALKKSISAALSSAFESQLDGDSAASSQSKKASSDDADILNALTKHISSTLSAAFHDSKQQPMPPPTAAGAVKKREFAHFTSKDENENADNEDPRWEIYRKLTSDEARYKLVRERWQSLDAPDPNRNLSWFGFARRRAMSKLAKSGGATSAGAAAAAAAAAGSSSGGLARGGNLADNTALQRLGKRKFDEVSDVELRSEELTALREMATGGAAAAAKKARTGSCTVVLESELSSLNVEYDRNKKDLFRKLAGQLNEIIMTRAPTLGFLQNERQLSTFLENYMHDPQVRQVVHYNDGMVAELDDQYQTRKEKLTSSLSEIEAFQKFYYGLENRPVISDEDATLLKGKQVDELWAIRKMFVQYGEIYH